MSLLIGPCPAFQMPHKQYHAPAKRGTTTSPGPEVLSKAAHLTALLTTAARLHPKFPKSAAVLLGDLVQLLYYFDRLAVGGQAAAEDGADVAELPAELIAQCAGEEAKL